MSSYIGKYVCYQAFDGSATFGLIKDEVRVSTRQGEQPSFIVCDRYTQVQTDDVKTYRRWYPNLDDLFLSRGVQINRGGLREPPKDYILKRIKGDSSLRLSSIDLKNDIIDPEGFLEQFATDEIFLALVVGRERIREGYHKRTTMMNVAEIGLRYVVDLERLKKELKKRSQ